ncbi:nitrogen-fixing NifU domain protein [Thermocrinis albus DSM 14484]|uniref:Nitrogen-fixing NifU domain protein n=1 Tax=Thermocrinis albus (strain DSM 14484 / JCM 11386 / HI 11/12) TaxID=638303 RepID=D3SLH8_THEAH|nr:NifU family protein [Thermocrinis albus]ADC89608.1 nitrogen-fixing NifU domain protein [Thermocrinis albus DSM 14484]
MEEEKLREVEAVLEKIRPALKEHHGNLKVVDIREGEIYLQFEGGCTDCPIVDASVKDVVDIAIRGNIPWAQKVEIVTPKYQLR